MSNNATRTTPVSSFSKALAILDLFQEGRISIHLEDTVQMLGTSRATAYRYLKVLCDAGLLSPTSGGTYVLGPRIIELDRLMRLNDPLLTAGRAVMQEVSCRHGLNMLLSSYYRDSIMCVDIAWQDHSIPPNYERGRPMSLFRGAMAKVILANLSSYQLRNVALHHADQIREAGLGEDWKSFRTQMAALCKEGSSVTRAELMPGSVGVAAPVFDDEKKIVGSVTFAIPDKKFDGTDESYWRHLIIEAAASITALIAQAAGPAVPAVGRSSEKPKVLTTRRLASAQSEKSPKPRRAAAESKRATSIKKKGVTK